MQIRTVTVRMGKTIPGEAYGGRQFENVKPEVELSACLEPGEDAPTIERYLSQLCKALLEETAATLIGRPIQQKPAYAPQPQPVHIAHPAQAQPAQPLANNMAGVRPAIPAPPPPLGNGIPKVDPVTF